ncbi:class I SAM-dependent methyltransferase [Vibrio sp. WXL103]|uniref:class I SAM-dependent methyltransferase n=1 Tax=Vibrio sp. WXL103 TaxID=3450710 RepID=UPI003EC4CFD8
MVVEFEENRSKSYKAAISNFPDVWEQDLDIMEKYLNPKPGNTIAELGAGSGFFSFAILDKIQTTGTLVVIDPSSEQLAPLYEHKADNLLIHCATAEDAIIPEDVRLDLIWSRGAFHHVKDKTAVMSKLRAQSEDDARCVIFDIFTGSSTAKFFDQFVAQTCTTGHEVSFLSKEFATSLCLNTGWQAPEFIDIPLRWKFNRKSDIGVFISQLLSTKPGVTIEDTTGIAEAILGIEYIDGSFYLNWPMTLMISKAD